MNVDFEGFARAVNALDCVYVDVDRRYFHNNDTTAAAADYEEIDLQPGYQALCGFDALDYARYRHTDNESSGPPASRSSCARPGRRSRPSGCSATARS